MVDPLHDVYVDNRLNPIHMHDAVNAGHVPGAPHVAITRDVFVHVVSLVDVAGGDWSSTTTMMPIVRACSGRGAYKKATREQYSQQRSSRL